MDFPKIIEIQFHNRCNSNCLICPYKDMNYKSEFMDEELFDKFLSELKGQDLKRIIPYLNNEPFIQNDYIERVIKIKDICPNAEIEISTNVSMLNEYKIKQLSEIGLTELRLSVFGYSDSIYKKMMPGLNKETVFKNLEIISREFINSNTVVSIVMIDDGTIPEDEFINMKKLADSLNFKLERWGFLDRCKNVTYKDNGIFNSTTCGCEQNRPLERMHILSNGDVIVCCQDWSHTTIMGNIKENTIHDIWCSEKYDQFRKSLYNAECETPELCKKCKLALTCKEA